MLFPCISLYQPYAHLWCCTDIKQNETRSWPCPPKIANNWLLVHAGKKPGVKLPDELVRMMENRNIRLDNLPLGAVIGAVYVTSNYRAEELYPWAPSPQYQRERADWLAGDYTKGRWAWGKSRKIVFKKPVPYSGLQRIFYIDNKHLPELAMGRA